MTMCCFFVVDFFFRSFMFWKCVWKRFSYSRALPSLAHSSKTRSAEFWQEQQQQLKWTNRSKIKRIKIEKNEENMMMVKVWFFSFRQFHANEFSCCVCLFVVVGVFFLSRSMNEWVSVVFGSNLFLILGQSSIVHLLFPSQQPTVNTRTIFFFFSYEQTFRPKKHDLFYWTLFVFFLFGCSFFRSARVFVCTRIYVVSSSKL